MEYLNKIKYVLQDYNIHLNNTFSKFKKNNINAYWCRANNFGDWLTPVLLKHYGLTPIFTCAYDAHIISVGSIMEQIPHLYKGNILGTGMITNTSNLSFPEANIIGVRGYLTKKSLNLNNTIVYGDPGLLISRIIPPKVSIKKYKVGILPHISDKYTNPIKQFSNKKNIKVIDPQQSPINVAKEIRTCSHILSSSLHGLIFADSYGIPNRRIVITGRLTGGDFKFNDYYSLLNVHELPISDLKGDESLEKLISYSNIKNQKVIEQIKETLHSEFIKLSEKYGVPKS